MRNQLRSETRSLLLALAASLAPFHVAAAEAAPAAPSPTAKAAAAQATPPADDAGPYAQVKAPLFSDLFADVPVAQVGDGVITLGQLTEGLATMHEDRGAATKGGKLNLGPALERLINVRLIVLEARTMGLDEQDEIAQAVKQYEATALREAIKAEVTKDVGFDADEVEKAYAETAKEWKLKSVLFAKEEDAKEMAAALAGGKSFDELTAQAVADKKAKGGEDGDYVPTRKLHGGVQAAVAKLGRGATTPPIKLSEGFAIVRVDDTRVGNDPDAREKLEQLSRDGKITQALHDHAVGLAKKYAKPNMALLKSLDYHAKKPGLKALFADKRILATIQGDKPVIVADLSAELSRKFYHGAKRAAEEKKLNAAKQEAFQSVLYRRLLEKEAARRQIAATDEFKRKIVRFEDGLLFGNFVQKVIATTVSVTEGEGEARYEEKKSSYMYPQFYKLESLAFATEKDAQAVIAKLRAGTDFKWLRANADNQVKDAKLQFDGQTFAASMLEEGMGKVLAGSKTGDFQYYAGGDGTAYVLAVVGDTPAAPQPYTAVREGVLNAIYAEKLTKAIEDWGKKLRAAHEVKVFVTRIGE
jgi:PPIC-type PPIASE domain